MVIDNIVGIGDEVYLKTDSEQYCRIVTGLILSKTDIIYILSCGATTSEHYDFEITTEKDVLKTTIN